MSSRFDVALLKHIARHAIGAGLFFVLLIEVLPHFPPFEADLRTLIAAARDGSLLTAAFSLVCAGVIGALSPGIATLVARICRNLSRERRVLIAFDAELAGPAAKLGQLLISRGALVHLGVRESSGQISGWGRIPTDLVSSSNTVVALATGAAVAGVLETIESAAHYKVPVVVYGNAQIDLQSSDYAKNAAVRSVDTQTSMDELANVVLGVSQSGTITEAQTS